MSKVNEMSTMRKLVSLNNWKNGDGMLPKAAQRAVREVVRLIKSALVCVAWTAASLSAYLVTNPEASPVSFQNEVGEITKIDKTDKGFDRITLTVTDSEGETVDVEHVRLKDLWVVPTDLSSSVSASLSSQLNQALQANQLGVETENQTVTEFNFIPSIR